ncbi:MAG: ABC transporter permease [Anaerolineae bacterium]
MVEQSRVFKANGLRLFWATMWARAYPRIVGAFRERSWMFFETFLPVMSVAGYVFLYRAIGAPAEYTGFAVLGGAMTAFWLNVLWSMASQLYWDKDQGNLEMYVLSPGPMMAVLLGMAVGGLVMTATRATVIIIICSFLFNVSYHISDPLLLVVVFTMTMAALYGMGMVFASVFLVAGREAWHLSNLLQEPIYLASGLYFPVRALGALAASLASVIPLTLGLDAMRQLMFSGDPTLGFLSPKIELTILSVLAVIFITVAYFLLAKLEQVGREQGRLIERRR